MSEQPADVPGPLDDDARTRLLALYDQLTAEQREVDDAAIRELLDEPPPGE